MAATSYNWLKVLEPELVHIQDLSATGGPEAFSWEGLSTQLAQRFEMSDLEIHTGPASWHTEKELASLLGRGPWAINFALSALPGQAAWVMSEKDVAILMAALLTKKHEPLDYSDKGFQKGFFRFVGIALTNALADLGFQGDYALSVLDSEELPSGTAMSLEVDLNLLGIELKGHLVASEDLVKDWKKRFVTSGRIARFSSEAAQNLEVTVHFEAGKLTLPVRELEKVHPGDFLILDTCTVLPGEDKGRVTMSVRGVPIFRGMLKETKVKVLEYPLYHPTETPMSSKDEEFDFEDDMNTDVDLESTTDEGSDDEAAAPTPASGPALGDRAKDIPVTVTVEVGRIQMRLEKLMQLQPGQLLELEVNPEEGVDLVVNGKCIGRGELLKLGEALGVRVLELG
ncbi:MAG: type III secretion system cytoplasmic ring protein SctQ [Chlamydiales bacterium]|nr:type III secretion system cytoplasmic ring protein SctQ [Chlamydiales bacterium]